MFITVDVFISPFISDCQHPETESSNTKRLRQRQKFWIYPKSQFNEMKQKIIPSENIPQYL